MELSDLVDKITEEIEGGLPPVTGLEKLRVNDSALYAQIDVQINARVADAISETVLALFRILGSGVSAQRVL